MIIGIALKAFMCCIFAAATYNYIAANLIFDFIFSKNEQPFYLMRFSAQNNCRTNP